MQFSIRDVACIERANININGITLLAGRNGEGKSTTARMIGSLLTGTAVWGVKKAEAGTLIRRGGSKAKAVLETETGTIELNYPKAEIKTEGTPPEASVYAVGLESIMQMDAKKRAIVLSEYLKTEPTKEDLGAAMRAEDFPDEHIEQAWKSIESDGWDKVLKKAKDYGAGKKGQWEMVTAEKAYQPTGADHWTPPGWDDDLAEASRQSLEGRAADTAEALETALKNQGGDESEVARLEEIIAIGAPDNIEELQEAVNEARAAFDALPPDPDQPAMTSDCPHCKKKVEVHRVQLKPGESAYELHKPSKGPSKDQVKKIRKQRHDSEATLRRANDALRAAEQQVRAHDEAAAKLEALKDREGSDAEVEAARKASEDARGRLDAFNKKEQADKLHRMIQRNQTMIDILGPEGVRKKRLTEALEAFNKGYMSPLTEAAGWERVELDEDLDLIYGGSAAREPYVSESMAMRAEIVLQVALAQLDGSDVVVVDRADRLDQGGRNGLVKMLQGQDFKACVLCMTFNTPKLVPDLGGMGGASYWVGDNRITPIADAKKEAA